MYYTRETIVRPSWEKVVIAIAWIVMLGVCWTIVMGEDAEWTTLERIDPPEAGSE